MIFSMVFDQVTHAKLNLFLLLKKSRPSPPCRPYNTGLCKAFDTVAHNRLLKFYGIQGKIHDWLSIWLMQKTQRVVLDGFSSNYVEGESGVPQGTVLGPIMFLLYINDINVGISSLLRLFADDCVLYRITN